MIDQTIKIHNDVFIHGSYEYSVVNKKTGKTELEVGEQDNLILDTVFDTNGFAGALSLCLGSGVVTAPAVTDTSLGNQIAEGNANFTYDSHTYDPITKNIVVRFKTTVVYSNLNAEISELGIRERNGSKILFTRALIKDPQGNPTTITITADQELHLTYYLCNSSKLLLGSGTTPTEFGDFQWEIRPMGYSYGRTEEDNASRCKNRVIGANFGFYSGWWYFESDKQWTSGTLDLANRKHTLTLKRNADPTSKTHQAGYRITRPDAYGSNEYYAVYISAPFTFPANYECTMTFEITWVRSA